MCSCVIVISPQDGYWDRVGSRPLRPMSTVVLPGQQVGLRDCLAYPPLCSRMSQRGTYGCSEPHSEPHTCRSHRPALLCVLTRAFVCAPVCLPSGRGAAI
jgi:hypothetical protein